MAGLRSPYSSFKLRDFGRNSRNLTSQRFLFHNLQGWKIIIVFFQKRLFLSIFYLIDDYNGCIFHGTVCIFMFSCCFMIKFLYFFCLNHTWTESWREWEKLCCFNISLNYLEAKNIAGFSDFFFSCLHATKYLLEAKL